jgi:hypothetical protein
MYYLFAYHEIFTNKNYVKGGNCFPSENKLACLNKDYNIDICCFSTIKYATLRSKSKDWLAQNHDMSMHGLLFE